VTALAALKAHLNILDDADDELLTAKADAAIAFTSHQIGKLDPDTGEAIALTWDTAPADVREAILMLGAHLYENREAVAVGVGVNMVPLGYHDLLLAHRRWVF